MAKISELKYEIKGIKYNTAIKVGKQGFFNATLPDEVSAALNTNKKLEYTTLSALENGFNDIIEKYKNSKTEQEIFIFIRYGASGHYACKNDGSYLFHNKYGVSLSLTNSKSDILLFHFKVCIKETVDGCINWFETKLGKDFPHWDTEQRNNPTKYYKNGKCHDERNYKKILFSEIALDTLKVAQEKIRQASELLFNFIEQDEEQILLTLTNQKLLH